MKVSEAIAEVDKRKPNAHTVKEKIRWLSRLERRIYDEILLTHELNEGEALPESTSFGENDTEKELLVGEPYDELYLHWLEAQIDYVDMEFDGFNAANTLFESVYGAFRNAYNQSHMPKGRKKIYY